MNESGSSRSMPSRRWVLKFLGASGATVLTSGCASFWGRQQESAAVPGGAQKPSCSFRTSWGQDFNPIDRTVTESSSPRFSGDNPDSSHAILWNKAEYLRSRGGVPKVDEHHPLVVVGGGISGIVSSYLLKRHQPVILERAARFGGNSRGESWAGIDYSIGAAYVMEPAPGSPIARLFQETGIDKLYRVKNSEDPVALNGRRFLEFWNGDSAPEARAQFQMLKKRFLDFAESRNGFVYPEIPIMDRQAREGIYALDRVSFKKYLEQSGGGSLHPHIETAIEHYCWSSFGTSSTELSAACGLNFYAAEFGGVCVLPGGNARIAEVLLEKLAAHIPPSCFRPDSLVVDVQVVHDGVLVTYQDHKKDLRTLHAKAVIMACPKFVTARVLQDIEPARLAAISRLRYHSYLVANVLVKGNLSEEFFNLFLLGHGAVDTTDIRAAANQQKTTDVILATYAKKNAQNSVLTLYRALPFDGARSLLLANEAYDLYHREFEDEVWNEILPLIGLRHDQVADLRLTRWGHPLPSADIGLIADGTIDQIRKPFRGRVFFVEQDNWMLPAFETSATEAFLWSSEIEKIL